MIRTAPAVLALLAPTAFAAAQEPEAPKEPQSLTEALAGGRTWLNLNYRVESADLDNGKLDGLASTLRTALGYESASFHGFRGLVEFEDVSAIGSQNYNSTTNGKSDYQIIPDPIGTEVNQVFLGYDGFEGADIRLGRQEINLGNQRFVGAVGWRQNHQSFDAARVDWTASTGTTLNYAYLDTVNRIFGEGSPAGTERMNSHLFDIRHPFEGVGELAAYAYLLDFDTNVALSSTTVGARFSGDAGISESMSFLYTAEYAQQQDAGDNPNDVSADYWLAELGLKFNWATFRVGNEQLGGSGDPGDKFLTPLATLHKFNGYADVFLVTPDTGLNDTFITASGKIGPVACALTYHLFTSDADSIDYGDEIDFTALYPITKRVKLGAKIARYMADEYKVDTNRAMAWINYRLL